MGAAARIGRGERVGPDPEALEVRTGYPWLLDLLDAAGVQGSFFIEGWNGVHHPERVRQLVDRGHDVGLHGWVHERWGSLSDHDAQRLIHDGTAALRRCGAASIMFRAPGGTSSSATRRCLSELGYTIDASLSDETVEAERDTSLTRVPFEWPLVDGYYYLHLHPDDPDAARYLERDWLRHISDATSSGETLVFIAHAFLSGATDRRRATFERVLDAAISSPDLDLVSLRELGDAPS